MLRESVAPILPSSLLNSPKKGFVIPLKIWLRNELLPLVKFLLDPKRIKKQGIFQTDLYSKIFIPFLEGKHDKPTQIWGLLMFQLWYLQFIDNKSELGPICLENFYRKNIQ